MEHRVFQAIIRSVPQKGTGFSLSFGLFRILLKKAYMQLLGFYCFLTFNYYT
jgi:hypothetical protein